MGIVKESLANINLCNNDLSVLNVEFNEEDIIHIQSKSFRIELTLIEFNEFTETIKKAYLELRSVKEL